MAKRMHFIEKDLETFFFDPNWEKTLKSKVDYTQANKFKDKYRIADCTFLGALVSYAILCLDGSDKFDVIFNVLDSKNYSYSNKDLVLPNTLGADISEEDVDGLINLFNLYESKGIKLKRNKTALNNSFGGLHHPKLDKYKLENNLVADEQLTHINFHHLHVIHDYNKCKQLGVFKFVSKKETAEAKTNYENSMKFIKEIIDSPLVSTEVLQDMLSRIPTNNDLFAKFIEKNKLEISLFSETQYFNSLKLKPKEVFTSDFIQLIELLEKKLGIQYLDNTGRNPKDVFEETLEETKEDFNRILIMEYKDGTSTPLNKKRKFN
jgi:hypothetical protein